MRASGYGVSSISPAELNGFAHPLPRFARVDHEVGDVGASNRRWYADQFRGAYGLSFRLTVRESHGARDDECEAALPRHALLNVVIAVETFQEPADEGNFHEPACYRFAYLRRRRPS
jgi:hypothetical protein